MDLLDVQNQLSANLLLDPTVQLTVDWYTAEEAIKELASCTTIDTNSMSTLLPLLLSKLQFETDIDENGDVFFHLPTTGEVVVIPNAIAIGDVSWSNLQALYNLARASIALEDSEYLDFSPIDLQA